MPSRSPARFLAPLALVAVALAVTVVVTSSGGGDGASTPTSTTSSTPVKASTTTTPQRRRQRRTYVVKPGDTLSAIALKTGVSLERIRSLNPSLDAQTLNAGDKVKLAP